MVLMSMTTLIAADGEEVSDICDQCGLRKEVYRVYHPDGPDPEAPEFDVVCPRLWAHGPADD
jgi:hypothetical protein